VAAPRYTVVDLFAGCGGMTRGFTDTKRFKAIFAVEHDGDAAATYAANFGGAHVETADIQEVDDFPFADVVIGGPPCQPFSRLNRTKASDQRREMWRHYLRALVASDAKAFVMENVPELVDSDEYAAFVRAARRRGYAVRHRILNAADYGVPQRRSRAIVIGAKGFEPAWPVRTHSSPRHPHPGCRPWVTFGAAVAGLSFTPDGANWHRGRNPRRESLIRYRAVPPDGGNRFEMQENLERAGLGDLVLPCFRRKPKGTTDVFGRLWWDRPAVTIRTEFFKPEKGRYLHPTEDRPITVREAARCMGFDDAFLFPEDQSMTSVARQIGNAVPPPLAEALAQALARDLDSASRTQRAA
jgi:DNA (cytosine-5)-methyltransferase 1